MMQLLKLADLKNTHGSLTGASGINCIQNQSLQSPSFNHLVKRHPCLSPEGHIKFGRIHLPVCPTCNIQCNFCRRQFNNSENRPGVSAKLLSPQDCVEKVEKALELCPDITVVGIAGPGDTLATDHALETFAAIHIIFPQLIMCMSTNGLLLAQRAEEVLDAGVNTLTVTVNGVQPEIVESICPRIFWRGKIITGSTAANILIYQQLMGIRVLAAHGVLVKVNTVLIPGANDHHIGEIAKKVSINGAALINIMPLIPQHKMSHISAPTCDALQAARTAAEKYLPVFRHCKQCRADAVGIPGLHQDFSKSLYNEPMSETFSHG